MELVEGGPRLGHEWPQPRPALQPVRDQDGRTLSRGPGWAERRQGDQMGEGLLPSYGAGRLPARLSDRTRCSGRHSRRSPWQVQRGQSLET